MSKSTIFNYKSLVHATAAVTFFIFGIFLFGIFPYAFLAGMVNVLKDSRVEEEDSLSKGSTVALTSFYPLDLIKFRVQLEDQDLLHKSTLEAIIYLLKNEGVGSLYRGLRPVVTTMGLSNFVYFYTFHGFKSLLPKEIQNAKTDLCLSILAGVINVLTTNPFWVVTNRLKSKEETPFNGILDGVYHIAKTEGIQALWYGVAPSLMLVSNPAIHFTIYEALKRRVNVRSATAFFILGAISKSIATIITYPIQLAQTRQRRLQEGRVSTAALLLMLIKKYGPGGIYQGLETKMLQTVLSTALMFMTYEKITQFVFALLLGSRRLKK